jgi:hypothetical protein
MQGFNAVRTPPARWFNGDVIRSVENMVLAGCETEKFSRRRCERGLHDLNSALFMDVVTRHGIPGGFSALMSGGAAGNKWLDGSMRPSLPL